MTLLETLPGVHRWCCTWCGREADRDEPCCEERMPAYEAAARSLWPVFAMSARISTVIVCDTCGREHPGADCAPPSLLGEL